MARIYGVSWRFIELFLSDLSFVCLIGFEGGEFQSRVASRAVVDNNLLFIQVPFVVGLAATAATVPLPAPIQQIRSQALSLLLACCKINGTNAKAPFSVWVFWS